MKNKFIGAVFLVLITMGTAYGIEVFDLLNVIFYILIISVTIIVSFSVLCLLVYFYYKRQKYKEKKEIIQHYGYNRAADKENYPRSN